MPKDEKVREALEWYAEQVAGCRKLSHLGDGYRQALDADGGKRAREALSTPPAQEEKWEGPAYEYGVTWGPENPPAQADASTLPTGGRHEIVASLIRDAIEGGTDEHASHAAHRIMAYLVEPKGCPCPGACSAPSAPQEASTLPGEVVAYWMNRDGRDGFVAMVEPVLTNDELARRWSVTPLYATPPTTPAAEKGQDHDLSRNDLVDLDHARLALFDAIGKIKIGNPTDDKLILDNLREAGFWICRLNPNPPTTPAVESGEEE